MYIYRIDQESKNNLVSNVSYLLKILLQAKEDKNKVSILKLKQLHLLPGLVKVGLRVEVLIGLSLHWK